MVPDAGMFDLVSSFTAFLAPQWQRSAARSQGVINGNDGSSF
jgi:hypothetical protein